MATSPSALSMNLAEATTFLHSSSRCRTHLGELLNELEHRRVAFGHPLRTEPLRTLVEALARTEAMVTELVERVVVADGHSDRCVKPAPFSVRTVAPFDGASQGKGVLVHALSETVNPTQIAADEFQVIDHGNDHYTVILAGVIDLAQPHLGWDPDHASGRDLDQAALASFRSTGIADNLYAQLVADRLARLGIGEGAHLLLIGHSFGADTAVDLAATPAFADHYTITHVVGAGYAVEPSLPAAAAASPETKFLVLRNRYDLIAAAEEIASIDLAPSDSELAHLDGVTVHRFGDGLMRLPAGVWPDAGHHPSRYTNDLRTHTSPDLARFEKALIDGGYGRPGTSLAINVAVDDACPTGKASGSTLGEVRVRPGVMVHHRCRAG